MKNTLSPLQRIKIVLSYLERRGSNKESVNKIYHKIIRKKFGI